VSLDLTQLEGCTILIMEQYTQFTTTHLVQTYYENGCSFNCYERRGINNDDLFETLLCTTAIFSTVRTVLYLPSGLTLFTEPVLSNF